jgi:hypothetical protein
MSKALKNKLHQLRTFVELYSPMNSTLDTRELRGRELEVSTKLVNAQFETCSSSIGGQRTHSLKLPPLKKEI